MKKINKNRNLYFVFLSLIVLLIYFSCSRESIFSTNINDDYAHDSASILGDSKLKITKQIYAYTFFLNSHVEGSAIISSLKIYNSTRQNLVWSSNYVVDTSDYYHKLNHSKLIIDYVLDSLKNIPTKELEFVNQEINDFAIYARDKVNVSQSNATLYHHSFPLHIAIFETKRRNVNNGDVCECTTHPAYLSDKQMFECIEDDTLETAMLKNIVSSKGYQDSFKNNTTALKFAAFINDLKPEQTSFKHC